MSVTLVLDWGINLVTLTLLELVLGVDNLVFIALMSHRLPQKQQKTARQVGLLLALITRVLLLSMAFWLIHLVFPLFSIFGMEFSIRDLFLILGGLFLIYKGTDEIHAEFLTEEVTTNNKAYKKFWMVITQIVILDIVFSFDSVITAVGMTDHFWIMVTAIAIAIAAMIFLAEPLSGFIKKNPTVRVLAFSFLLMIGMVLVADGLEMEIPRGYVYFAVAFSIFVEMLNLLLRGKQRKKSQRGVKK